MSFSQIYKNCLEFPSMVSWLQKVALGLISHKMESAEFCYRSAVYIITFHEKRRGGGGGGESRRSWIRY